MMSEDKKQSALVAAQDPLPVFWSQNHEILYSNAFQVRFTEMDFTFDVATQQNINGQNGIYSTAQVVMPIKNAKLLGIAITEMFRLYEQKFGPVELPKSKVEPLLATIVAAMAELPAPEAPWDGGRDSKALKKSK